MEHAAAIRAALTRGFIRAAEDMELEALDGVVPKDVERLKSMTKAAWLEFETHLRIITRVRANIGPPRYIEAWKATFLATVDTPLLMTFIKALLRLRSNDPKALLSQGPRIYTYLLRGTGSARALTDAGDRTIIYELRDSIRGDGFRPHAEGVLGSLLGMVELSGNEGRSSIEDEDPSQGFLRYRVDW